MDKEPRGIGAILLPLGMVACCGIPILLTTGVLSGVGAWLADGGIPIIIGTVIAAVGFLYIWRRIGGAGVNTPQSDDQVTLPAREMDTDAERRKP